MPERRVERVRSDEMPERRVERVRSDEMPERRVERVVERPPEPLRDRGGRDRSPLAAPELDMERFRVEVGYAHGIKAKNIVGAIANEVGIDSEFIGRITIFDDHSLVDLPVGMPREVFHSLRAVRVSGHRLNISRIEEERRPTRNAERAAPRTKKKSAPEGKNKGKPKRKERAA
ncbi:MAG: DbpA RNA binding domain-containing protein [Myxococcales bacterium]|nr:DbpA RNA binding domain-containing protein [Myxococcales bacterium]